MNSLILSCAHVVDSISVDQNAVLISAGPFSIIISGSVYFLFVSGLYVVMLPQSDLWAT